jgi:hypothetical protein
MVASQTTRIFIEAVVRRLVASCKQAKAVMALVSEIKPINELECEGVKRGSWSSSRRTSMMMAERAREDSFEPNMLSSIMTESSAV